MKNAYIIGSGGHGHVIASIINNKYDNIYFADNISMSTNINQSYFFSNINIYRDGDIFIGIGDNINRIKIYEQLISLGITPANCIAEYAFIAHDAIIGNGVVICPGCVIGARAIIGNNTIVNTLSSVDHDCVLGDNSQITAGVTFGGAVKAGKNSFFGIKSAVLPKISVGDNSIIMAGSIVYKDVPRNVVAGGNPARVIKNIE